MRRVLVLLALLTACSTSSTSGQPAAEQSVRPESWTVELGTAPTLLLLTEDDVLAASYGNGVGGSQVYRVDRSTGRLVEQRTVAGQPHGMALDPDGALWLATLQLPDQPSGTGLQVLDPTTLQTRRVVQVEAVPLSVAFVDAALWVGDDRGVSRLDPATGAVQQRIATAHPANRLVAGPQGIVVVGPAGLQAIDPASGRAGPVRPLPSFGSATATGDERLLWVVHPDGAARAVLSGFDPVSLAPMAAAPSPGSAGAAAYLADDVLWVTDPSGGRLLCADPMSGQPRSERPVVTTGPVVADDATVVLAQANGLTGVPARCD